VLCALEKSAPTTVAPIESAVERPPLESLPRRRPQATDPGMMSALRGTQRRPEPAAEPAVAQRAAVAKQPELEPEVAAVAEAPAPAARSYEARAATAPSPADIRARAEEVRQRAMAARNRRENEPPARPAMQVIDDEPSLFDTGRSDPEPAPFRPEPEVETRPRAEPVLAGERRPFIYPPSDEGRGQGARSGLFAINKLINRVAGSVHTETRADARPAPQEPSRGREQMEDDEGEIPAFLRRQAN